MLWTCNPNTTFFQIAQWNGFGWHKLVKRKSEWKKATNARKCSSLTRLRSYEFGLCRINVCCVIDDKPLRKVSILGNCQKLLHNVSRRCCALGGVRRWIRREAAGFFLFTHFNTNCYGGFFFQPTYPFHFWLWRKANISLTRHKNASLFRDLNKSLGKYFTQLQL